MIKLELGLKQILSQMLGILKMHIGSRGPKAHANATEETSGFMSADQVTVLKAAEGERFVVGERDILTLRPGNYLGTAMLNMPNNDTGNFLISIKDEKIKQLADDSTGKTRAIDAIHTYTGRHFVRNERAAGQASIPEGWRSLVNSKNIFKGKAKQTGTDIILTDFIYRFDLLEIVLNDGVVQYVKVLNEGGEHNVTTFNIADSKKTVYLKQMVLKRTNNYTLKIMKNVQMSVSSAGNGEADDQLEILEINGIQS